MAKVADKKKRTTTEEEKNNHNSLMAEAKKSEKPNHEDPDSGLLRPKTFAQHP